MSKSNQKTKFIPIAALTFVNVVGTTIFIPVLPFIVQDYQAPTWVYGLLLASYPAAQFFGAPILGELSDRIGRKPVLLLSQLGTLISWFILAISYYVGQINGVNPLMPISVLLFARVVDGLTGGNVSVANAYLADITPTKELTAVFGKIGAITGFAVVAGPAIGSYSSSTSIGYLGMAITSIVISVFTLLLMWRYLEESLVTSSYSKRTESRIQQINIASRIKQLKTKKGGKLMLGINAGFGIVMAGYSSIIALFLIDRFLMTQTEVGNFLFLIGVMLIFNQYVLVPRFINKFGDIKTFIIGLLLLGAGLFIITLTENFIIYTFLYYLLNLGISLLLPTGKSLISQSVDADKQGEIQGLDESLKSASRAIMPIFMGLIYGFIAYKSFYILSVISIVVVVIFVIFHKELTFSQIKKTVYKRLFFINVD